MAFKIPINFVIVVSCIFFFLFLVGIHHFLTKIENNDCEMTYMFEYPTYVEITIPLSIRKQYPRYGLYGYSEGRLTEDLRKMRFTGIPVLYIPGSGGSYRQGRSLASISLRKWVNARSYVHYDYFLVDFNEEYSAIYGGVLQEQTKFVQFCISKILSLYSNDLGSRKPTSIVVIGHSMGGLVAKSILLNTSIDPRLINILITLATPHKSPVFYPDAYVESYYRESERFAEQRAPNGNLSHITFVSIGGGARDIIVRSDQTHDNVADVNVMSNSVPGVWCSADHLSIVWCKQLVLSIVRALYDCVDPSKRLITADKKLRDDVFRYHLIQRSNGKKYSISHHARFSSFDKGGNWVEHLQRQFSVVEHRGVARNHYVMIRLLKDIKHEMVAIETINLDVKDWLFACRADYVHNFVRMCENGENLSNMSLISPSHKHKRRFAALSLFDMKDKGFTHVIVRFPISTEYVQANIDVHSATDRNLNYTVPRVWKYTPELLLETPDNALHYTVYVTGLEQIWQSYIVTLEAVTCRTAASHASVTFKVPWAHQDTHGFLVDQAKVSTVLKLTSTKPHSYNGSDLPTLKFILDPSCKYQITLQPYWAGMFGQIVRYYSHMLPGFMFAVVLLTLRRQILMLHESADCTLYNSALAPAVRNYYVILQIVMFGSKILGIGFITQILPKPDMVRLQEENLDFFALPLFIYGVAVFTIYLIGFTVYASVIFSGAAAHKLALRFIAKTITGFITWSEWVFTALHQLPFVASALLISLAMSTCGGLALWVGAAFYYLKLCKMYEEYLEELFKISIKYVAKKFRGVTKQNDKVTEVNNIKPIEDEIANSNRIEDTEDERLLGAGDGISTNHRIDENGKTNEDEKQVENTNVEEVVIEKEVVVGTLSSIHFHVTVFVLWAMTALVYVPSVLVWAKSFPYNVVVENDPALLYSIVFSTCGAFLWQGGPPASYKYLMKVTPLVLYGCAIASLLYCSLTLHRLGLIGSIAISTITLDQLIARYRPFDTYSMCQNQNVD